MSIVLNIGLARNDGKGNNRVVETLAQLEGYVLDDVRLVNSRTEPTLVVEVALVNLAIAAILCQRLSVALAQDCVACYSSDTGEGSLHGPKADAWGPFDPTLFYLPNSLTLAEEAAAQAYFGRGTTKH